MGKAAMNLTRGLFPKARELQALHEAAREQLDIHTNRAKELIALFKS
jgi:hypothetical protein